LIEMIGVLAIVAILASIIVSTTTRRLDIAAANLESTTQVRYAAALQASILRNRNIPGTNNWADTIAVELGVNTASITTSPRNLLRCFLIDRKLQIGTGGLPYFQSNIVQNLSISNQMNPPFSPRVMIVSSLSTPLPSFVTNGTYSDADFSNLWNWSDQSSAPPTNWPANWNNRGNDLVVQRIDLTSLFVHVTLQNYLPTDQGSYAVDGLPPNPVTNGVVSAYLLKNSILGLLIDPGSGGTNQLQADQVLSRDASFFCVEQVWRGSLNFGPSSVQTPPVGDVSEAEAVGAAFAATAGAFIRSPYNILPSGMTPLLVVNSMSNFMSVYNSTFPAIGLAYAAQMNMVTDMSYLTNN
jgi:type II secretory pathway pseudopilin PulG